MSLLPAASLEQDQALGPGFSHFYNNEYDQALAIFEQQVRAQPDDATAYNAIAQAILYREMYRDGALESELVTGSNAFLRRSRMEVSPQDKAQFMNAVNRAIYLSSQQLQQNSKNVAALYSLAVAHGLRANFLFLVNKSWMQALRESVAARRANDQVLEIDPGFVDAHLIHGISEYTVGCLPAYLRVLATVDGFHGDKEDGVRQLQSVYRHGVRARFDAAILLAAIYRRDHRPEDAIPLLKTLASTFPRNYLFPFEEVQMYSDLGNKAAALRVLAEIETALSRREPGYARLPLARVQYARGNLLFWYGDLDRSLEDLKLATRNTNELDLSTAIMAWLRLGQVYDLLGDRADAVEAYRMTISTAPHSEPANEAAGYLDRPYRRKEK
ncbi:MAG: tetratricopeptide repeat protein [Acidobacteriaceae bacterium]|nr:tetratricopeptide repeat protein [Acidobacteriaceae bacterium]